MPTTHLPDRWTDDHNFLRRVQSLVNRILHGAHNEVHDITMSNGAVTTRFPAGTDLLERITPSTVCVLVPTTISAAQMQQGGAAVAPNYLWAVPNIGYITFNHAAIAAADLDFKLLLFGD